MVQYQKYMFDNFVITCDEDACIAEPLDVEQQTEIDENVDENSVENIVSENYSSECEFIEVATETDKNASIEATEEIVAELSAPVVQQIIPKGYTQEELDSAVADAVAVAVAEAEAKAYEKGYTEASSNQQMQQAQVLEEMEKQISALLSGIDTKLLSNEEAALKLGLEAVRKILPSLEPDVAKKELTVFLSDNFANFRQENSLSFSFNPEMAAEIAPQLSKLAERNDFEGRISVHKDIDLGLSDCRVEWKNGGVEKSSSKILNKIEELISK